MGCSKKVAYNSRQVKLMTGLLLLLPGLIVLFPVQAWALQTHGAPEGIIVHQMAHVFYFGALVYLFWDLRRTMSQGRGWKFLQIFASSTVIGSSASLVRENTLGVMRSTLGWSVNGQPGDFIMPWVSNRPRAALPAAVGCVHGLAKLTILSLALKPHLRHMNEPPTILRLWEG